MAKTLSEQIREYNLWRRGDEDLPHPDPRELGITLDAAADRLEVLEKFYASVARYYRMLEPDIEEHTKRKQ